jgi:glucokinase
VTYVGIDVGGTKCLGVAINDNGELVGEVRCATPHADTLVPVLVDIYTQLGGVNALGVGVPGLISAEGVIRASPNLKGAFNVEVGPMLREQLGGVVTVENDATMAAYGEWRGGAARDATDAVIVTLGTGIGGGIVMGGVLQRGAHGFAGEIGHMTVDRDGVECPCGRRGCWERYASGSALTMLSGGLSGEELFAQFNDGDANAIAVMEQFVDWIALGLSSLTNVCDPHVIVLGGGVITSLEPHFDMVRDRFVASLYSSQWRPHPELKPAQLGDKAGALGAAHFARETALKVL